MDNSAVILAELTPENSGDWQFVGDVMRRLNKISEVSVEGQPWHNVVLEVLAANGHPVSSGHLHRIRRSFDFLDEGMRERGIPKGLASLAKISSLDQAERLFQLDREAGLDALEACFDIQKPATKADIQKRYEDYLAAHPEKKTPMQAAWDRRRSKQGTRDLNVDADRSIDKDATKIATTLRDIAKYVIKLETEAQSDAEKIAALEQEISDINAELTKTKQYLQITTDEHRDLEMKRIADRD
jgi:hypothetical protein